MNPENAGEPPTQVLHFRSMFPMARSASWLELSRARAAVARGDFDQASPILEDLANAGEGQVAARAKIQLGLVAFRLGDTADAEQWLGLVREWVGRQHDVRKEYFDNVSRAASQLNAEAKAYFELQLELARVWTLIDHPADARQAYGALLREPELRDQQGYDGKRIKALAEYRLGELLVEDAPEDAYERWRKVLAARDEELSPVAALRMATDIGNRVLLTQRVERLFNIAMGSSDPIVRSRATLGLARHLKRRHQLSEARRYLETVVDAAVEEELVDEARTELSSLEHFGRNIANRERLNRLAHMREKVRKGRSRFEAKRVLVVGAGTGGSYLLESLDPERYEVCGFVDDSARGVPDNPEQRVLGEIDDLARIIVDCQPDEVLLAIPTLAGSRRKAVVAACRETSTNLLNLPWMYELGIGWTRHENRSRLMTQLRPVEIEETIGEHRVELDTNATDWLRYETVLVMGAGALGSEICRRLVDGEVGRIVVVDRRESAVRKIENDLKDTREFDHLWPRLGDATNLDFLADAFRSTAPYVVFNTIGDTTASALEPGRLACDRDGWKTIFSNEIRVALAATRAVAAEEVPRLIHVSSRRAEAVQDPLGALKALCEEIVLWRAHQAPKWVQSVVRIGPLLDSRNGPLSRMKKQIEDGATVTIPGPGAKLRFLPTARWAELALHAGRLAENGDLLEADGGVEIVLREIAEEAIRLHGSYPDDILIKESTHEHWDEPRAGRRRTRQGDDQLDVFALRRPLAQDLSLQSAIERCIPLVAEHAYPDSRADAEAGVSDFMHRLFEDLRTLA